MKNLRFNTALIPVSKSVRNNIGVRKIHGKYYAWFWVEFSKEKTKRRKKNKVARKQRGINNLKQ